jgi:outer membrane protein TolC
MKRILFGFSFLLIYAAAQAAEPLTWQQCVQITSQNNPDLISAQKAVAERQAQYAGSYSGLTPRIGLSSSYNDSKGHPTVARWRADGSATIDLFNQSRFAAIKSAGADFDEAQANLQLVSASVLFSLRKAFADLLYAQEQIQVSQRIYDIRNRDADLVTLSYNSGRESKGNKMRAQAQLFQAKADLAQATRDLRSAQQELNQQLGNDQFNPLIATGTFATAGLSVQPDAFDTIVNDHPSVKIQTAAYESAKADLKQAWSSAWPVLSANYDRSFFGSSWFPDQASWTASGVLSLPIFGGGLTSTFYGVKGARRGLEKSDEDLRSTRNQVRSDLESNWSDFAGSRDQVAVQAALLEAARQRNGEADVRYASGLLSFENWEQIVTDRVNFERSLVRAQQTAMIAEAQWNKTVGKGLGE